MKRNYSYPILLLLTIISFGICSPAYADNDEEKLQLDTLQGIFKYDMGLARSEYYYHASRWRDSKEFSTTREQILITEIEGKYFITGKRKKLEEYLYLIRYAPSSNFARMFLRYGVNAFDTGKNYTALILAVRQEYEHVPKDLTPDEIRAIIAERATYKSRYAFYKKFGETLSANHAIELAQLYLALGEDFWASSQGYYSENALTNSFMEYFIIDSDDDRAKSDSGVFIEDVPAIEPIPDYYTIQPRGDGAFAHRKSKVTYWLEEFIEAGYPASMLDTHKLHYPRFMKEASVAEITAMLNNPDTHKISANINCPYKDTCPLTPSVNMQDAMGRTPLHIAGEQGNKAVFNALIQIGADESIKDFRGNLAGLK